MNPERAIDKALGRIDQDAVTRLAVDLVSIPSPTGAEREVATFLASDDTCIMREEAMEAVVFGAGGVRYRGLEDGKGLGIGGEAVSIADMLNVARVYAATAVDTCSKKRDVLKLRDQWAEEPA